MPACIGKQPGDTLCLNGQLVECGPDLVTSDVTTCEFACQTGACTGSCVPGDRQCDGMAPQVCSSSGDWQGEAPCAYVCIGPGTCTGVCTPGAKTCDGKIPQACDAQGQWEDGAACEGACNDGTCGEPCTDGATQCSGNTAQTCASGLWVDTQACQYVCVAGACSGDCAPSSKQCSGSTPQTCNAQGKWQSGDPCEYVCIAGTCTGVCAPGSADCLELVPRTCNASGQWQSGAACPYLCSDGSCTGVCTPGTWRCGEQTPQKCDTSGQWVDAGSNWNIVNAPQTLTLFYDSFESPKTGTCDVTTKPAGWVTTNHPSYARLESVDCDPFSTPYGSQALHIYSQPPPAVPTTATTTFQNLNRNLAPHTIYTLIGNVAKPSNLGVTNYHIELLAIDDVNNLQTALAVATGSVAASDMSQVIAVRFCTGGSHANQGERLAVRLQKDPSDNWQSNPYFDNVKLTATGTIP